VTVTVDVNDDAKNNALVELPPLPPVAYCWPLLLLAAAPLPPPLIARTSTHVTPEGLVHVPEALNVCVSEANPATAMSPDPNSDVLLMVLMLVPETRTAWKSVPADAAVNAPAPSPFTMLVERGIPPTRDASGVISTVLLPAAKFTELPALLLLVTVVRVSVLALLYVPSPSSQVPSSATMTYSVVSLVAQTAEKRWWPESAPASANAPVPVVVLVSATRGLRT
jgi:hypothetical protein